MNISNENDSMADLVAVEVERAMGPYGQERLSDRGINPIAHIFYTRSQVYLIRALMAFGVILDPEEFVHTGLAAGFRHVVATGLMAWREGDLTRIPRDIGHIGRTVSHLAKNVRAEKQSQRLLVGDSGYT